MWRWIYDVLHRLFYSVTPSVSVQPTTGRLLFPKDLRMVSKHLRPTVNCSIFILPYTVQIQKAHCIHAINA